MKIGQIYPTKDERSTHGNYPIHSNESKRVVASVKRQNIVDLKYLRVILRELSFDCVKANHKEAVNSCRATK